MSVTFDRSHLLRVAKKALAEHDKAGVRHAAAVEKYKASHAVKRTKLTREYATTLRDALTQALKTHGPVCSQTAIDALGSNHLRDRLYDEPSTYDINQNVIMPKGLLKAAEVAETRALIAVLEAATGDTISVNELKLLGLKNLQPVFIAAGEASTPR